MQKHVKIAAWLVAGVATLQIGSMRGKWFEMTAPALHEKDLGEISSSLEAQRRSLIDFQHKSCQLLEPCLSAAPGADNVHVVQTCRASAKSLSEMKIPELPAAVKKNLEIYHRSLVNSSSRRADNLDIVGKFGGTFWTYVVNWEIDTCGPQSIPQKIYRLYGLNELSHTEIVTCKEVEKLHQERLAASAK